MIKQLILLLLLTSTTTLLKAQVDPLITIELQSILNNSVSNAGNNGVSAHLIMPNGETWNGTAGFGKDDLPITPTTVFHGASTTKLNIATLILLLAEENLIDLDESWTTYISLDAEFNPSITVRHLLNHTSGIADYLETASSGNDITSDFNNFFTPQYILENIVSDVPLFLPGTGFRYSNSNYALAALIAETVTGNPVHTELRNRIWNPLGMTHTYFGAYENYTESSAGVWWNFGNGLTDYNDMATTSMLSYAYGAGNIVTCPTDLALFLSAVINGQLLSTESLDEMMDFGFNSFSSWTAGYGLGLHHSAGQPDDVVLGHDGYYTNLTSMFHSRDDGFTLVTMTNTQTEWFGLFNPMYDELSDYFLSTDVNEFDKDVELMVYPNPTEGQFDIVSARVIDEVEVKDMLGKVIYRAEVNAKKVSVAMDVEGLYFLVLRFGERRVVRTLLVENKN
ncbi:MAG: D-alanyl-D-alanine carboxypeptidase [Polaribacter sp.]|jgi:D-alanyl-D-alanine carboxypeptidase